MLHDPTTSVCIHRRHENWKVNENLIQYIANLNNMYEVKYSSVDKVYKKDDLKLSLLHNLLIMKNLVRTRARQPDWLSTVGYSIPAAGIRWMIMTVELEIPIPALGYSQLC